MRGEPIVSQSKYVTIAELARETGIKDCTLRVRFKKDRVTPHHNETHRVYFARASIAHLLDPPKEYQSPAEAGLRHSVTNSKKRLPILSYGCDFYRPRTCLFGMYARDEINLNYEPLKEY